VGCNDKFADTKQQIRTIAENVPKPPIVYSITTGKEIKPKSIIVRFESYGYKTGEPYFSVIMTYPHSIFTNILNYYEHILKGNPNPEMGWLNDEGYNITIFTLEQLREFATNNNLSW
jgi:hypothetical protein